MASGAPSTSATSDSVAATSAAAAAAAGDQQVQAPPRRRLVKRSHVDDPRKREAPAALALTAPPGFGGTVNNASDRAPNSASIPAPPANISPGFRERDRSLIRPSSKEMFGDHASPHGGGMTMNAAKPGKSYQHMPIEGRPPGRRPEGMRRHDSFGGQKHGEELRIEQGKRAAIMRVQQAGAPGNFKSFDSPFGNFLIPVIPMHFSSKPQSSDIGGTPFLSASR